MRKSILGCLMVLAVQIGLAVWSHWPAAEEGVTAKKGLLLGINPGVITELLLEDAAGQSLILKKIQGKWVIPGQENFPADSTRVQALVERLAALQRGWPEASTVEAASRFQVAAERFAWRLTLSQEGNEQGKLYFGTSPGLRKLYCRKEGDKEILAMAVTPQELDLKIDNWIDTKVLHLETNTIKRLILPSAILVRQGQELQPEGLGEQEEVIKDQLDSLVKTAAGLTVRSLLGKERKAVYGLETPLLRFSIELEDGKTVEYTVGREAKPQEKAPADGTASPPEPVTVVQVSGHQSLFQVDGWQIDALLKADRASLIRTKPAPQEAEPADRPPVK